MLLTFPADILLVIFLVVVFVVGGFLLFLGIFSAKQGQDVRNEPRRIKKKSDSPEMPSEGQKDKPIDEADEEAKN